jgi:tetratricopeptide (TPR) repeat protein
MAEIPPQTGDEHLNVVMEYVSRLLGQLDLKSRRAVEWCALPHYIDPSIIEHIKPADVSAERILDQLGQYSFVEEHSGTYVYHESVRDHLKNLALLDDPTEFRVKQEALAKYFLAKAERGGLQDWSAAGEALYHLLCSGDSKGIALLRRLYDRAEGVYALGLCRRIVTLAVEASPVSEEGLSWIRYHSARLAFVTGEQSLSFDILSSLQAETISDLELRYRVLSLSGAAAGRLGTVRQAIEYHLAALRVAEDLGSADEMLEECYQLGRNCKRLGDFSAAELWHRRALALPETDNTRGQRAAVLLDMGNVLTYTGRWQEAEMALIDSRRLYRDVSRVGEMEATQRLGWLKRMTGKVDEALELHLSAIAFFEELGILFPLGAAVHSYANVLRDERRWAESRDSYFRALSIFEKLSSRRHSALVSRDLAYVESKLNEWQLAAVRIPAALVTLKLLDDRGAYAEALLVQGQLAMGMGDIQLAATVLPTALETSRETGNRELETRVLFELSRLHVQRKAFDRLEATGRELLVVAKSLRQGAALARGQLVLGEVCLHRENVQEAIEHLTTAIELAYDWNTYVGEELIELITDLLTRAAVSDPRMVREVCRDILTRLEGKKREEYTRAAGPFRRLLADT